MELLKWSLAPWASDAPIFSLVIGMGAEDAVALCTSLLCCLLLCCVVNLQILPNCQECSILLIIFCQEHHLLKPWLPFLVIIVSAVSFAVGCVLFWSLASCFLVPYSASGRLPIFSLYNIKVFYPFFSSL